MTSIGPSNGPYFCRESILKFYFEHFLDFHIEIPTFPFDYCPIGITEKHF